MQRATKTTEELEKMAKHKGRAYECLHCSRQGKTVIDVKSRVEDHILKYHLGLDQAPFYCTLCLFRSTEKKPLLEHVFRHSRHRQEAQNKNIVDSTPYLKESQNPYKLGSADYHQLSQEESVKTFVSKMLQNQERSQQDLLGRAFDEVFPHGIPELDSPVQECAIPPPTLPPPTTPPVPMPVLGVQTPQPVIQTAASQTSNMLTTLLFSGLQHTLQQSFGASGLMNSFQTPDIIPTGPPSGCGSASGEAYKPSTEEQRIQGMLPPTTSRSPSLCGSASGLIPRPVPEQTPAPVSSPGTIHTNTEARSTLSTPQPGTSAFDDFPPAGENILPQLLGIDDAEEHATKSPLAREPHQNVTVADTPPADAKNDFLAQCFNKLQAQLEQHNKNLLEEINKNTRSMRCMEKAMREQVEVLNSLLRINAREERRREERREEERKEERRREERREKERKEERRREEREEERQREAAGKRKGEEQQERQGKRRKGEKENSSPKLKSVLGQLYPEKSKRK